VWSDDARNTWWAELGRPIDLLVIGGGIVGAGIAREAAQRGFSVLLVEQADFASGTSSRSSKFVHGGLRYLKNGAVHLTHQSVRARDELLRHGPGLVTPISFLMAHYRGTPPGLGLTNAVLSVYDVLGAQRTHRRHSLEQVHALVPGLAHAGLTRSYSYVDGQTDDARLTLRVLTEAVAAGTRALNYVRALALVRQRGWVVGAQLHDRISGHEAEVRARVVVNATGAWADRLRAPGRHAFTMRPLRGSHLIFPAGRFPLSHAVNFTHPHDRRAVTFAPWEGATLVGTTDVDHRETLDDEPRASPAEVRYLMAAVDHAFPGLSLNLDDVIATFAGVRPVVDTGHIDPSRESREHLLDYENGLLTVAGGKLTTYHIMALTALDAIPSGTLPHRNKRRSPPLNAVPTMLELPKPFGSRLLGRYGEAAHQLMAEARSDELEPLPDLPTIWAELRWAARHEAVQHLDDLLLRRVRIGLLLPQGAEEHLSRIHQICRDEIGWDEPRWQTEVSRYREIWRSNHSVPGPRPRAD
jgi:glycerol-3-phosphate dehydrogenase